jgi:pimeloyl-ACP methyl ester carboxylesterase
VKKKIICFVLPLTIIASPSVSARAGQAQGGEPTTVHFTARGRAVHGLLWGKGPYGVVLSHGAIYDAASWTPLAVEIGRNGMAALALEEVEPDDILAAQDFLREHYRVKATALIGASAGGSTALRAMARSPQKWDQLILLSSAGDVSMIGPAPKLFVASEGEGMTDELRRMAKESAGEENDVLICRGSAHAQAIFRTAEGPRLSKAILERLINRAKSLY